MTIKGLTCGIIMPIASMADYSSSHWQDVKAIIKEATSLIEKYQFTSEIVSDSDGEVNIIHKNIVWNIYNSDIVVCDISGRNPNVLFELGMRLTFDKPTVIIKDKDTPFMFDTGSIETIEYPKDLRFGDIVTFKSKLAKKIQLTYDKSKEDPTYSTFLGHFGEFKVPALNQKAVTEPQELILSELSNIRDEIINMKKDYSQNSQELNRNIGIGRKSSFKPKPSDLSRVVSELHLDLREYFKYTKDSRSPNELLRDTGFVDFMKNSISPTNIEFIPESVLQDMIFNAQKEAM